MPVFYLDHLPDFPPTHYAEEDGLLAIGGELTPERIISAYQKGIFPWYNEGEPYLWWTPAPRFVLYPNDLHISRSVKRKLNQNFFQVTTNLNFKEVINICQQIPRNEQDETWIADEMKSAYISLHKQGFAHSIEVWKDKNLVGGIYGIALGKVFFGESMFSKQNNASKYGIIKLIQKMPDLGLEVLDCQMQTDHMEKLGGKFVHRKEFEAFLPNSLEKKTIVI